METSKILSRNTYLIEYSFDTIDPFKQHFCQIAMVILNHENAFIDLKFQHLQTNHPFFIISVSPFLPIVYQIYCLKSYLLLCFTLLIFLTNIFLLSVQLLNH